MTRPSIHCRQFLIAAAIALLPAALSPTLAMADEDEYGAVDRALLQALPSAKLDLAQGVKQAERDSGGAAISAKFEMGDDGKLSLSVYIAGKGLEADPEHNVLEELAASPAALPWKPETEVFKDVEHVARSAQHLVLVALSRKSLSDIIAEAARRQSGVVYSVTPQLRDRKAIFEVLVVDGDGEVIELDFDARSGRLSGRRERE